LRRTLLARNALSGWGAWVRGDLDLCVVRFSRDWHYEPRHEWARERDFADWDEALRLVGVR